MLRFSPPAELPCNPIAVEVLLVQNPPALCLRDICRHEILLWKLTKLLRAATSLCPLLLQMSNDRLLFILLNMHFSRAAFFPCLDNVCGSLLTAFKRGWIHTQYCKLNLNSARYYIINTPPTCPPPKRKKKKKITSDPQNAAIASEIDQGLVSSW